MADNKKGRPPAPRLVYDVSIPTKRIRGGFWADQVRKLAPGVGAIECETKREQAMAYQVARRIFGPGKVAMWGERGKFYVAIKPNEQ